MQGLIVRLILALQQLRVRVGGRSRLAKDRRRDYSREEGFSTAELLGNAALGIIALVAIWGLLKVLGQDVVEFIKDQIFSVN